MKGQGPIARYMAGQNNQLSPRERGTARSHDGAERPEEPSDVTSQPLPTKAADAIFGRSGARDQ
jgi:hypothetical protein